MRERQSTSRARAEREGNTESKAGSRLQAPSCQHRARCGVWTHKPWDHDLSQSQTLSQLSHPGAPTLCHLWGWVKVFHFVRWNTHSKSLYPVNCLITEVAMLWGSTTSSAKRPQRVATWPQPERCLTSPQLHKPTVKVALATIWLQPWETLGEKLPGLSQTLIQWHCERLQNDFYLSN